MHTPLEYRMSESKSRLFPYTFLAPAQYWFPRRLNIRIMKQKLMDALRQQKNEEEYRKWDKADFYPIQKTDALTRKERRAIKSQFKKHKKQL